MGKKKELPKNWMNQKSTELLKPERVGFNFEKLDVIRSEDLPELLPPEKAASMLNITKDTLAGWRRKKLIQGIKVGRTWHYTPEQIAQYLLKQASNG